MTLISCWDRWITSSAFIETLFLVQIYSRDTETYRTIELILTIHIFALRWRDEIIRSSQLRTLLKRVVVNRTWKKFPMTSAIPVQRSTNWANKPTGSWSMNWVQINIQVNEDFRYMKIHIFALRWRDEIIRSSQLRTLLLSNSLTSTKNSRLQ